MAENLINFIRTIGPWAPIPLFAESLRSQGELVSAIMTREYLPACMTGCVRDFGYLWNIDYLGVFGHSQVYRLRFSGRRQALVFISMLPATQRVDRWAWWDVFMPDNDRRRRFHAELEDLGLFSNATRWQDEVSNKRADGEEQVQRPAFANDILQEAANMLNGPVCSTHLKNYLEKVLPT
ncbi:hypothetical protein ACLX1H_005924 [Fusarium chlamydosporum]